MYMPAEINILIQASKLLPTIPPVYKEKLPDVGRCVGDDLSENKIRKKMRICQVVEERKT
jgi:hypothetical protein